MPPEGESLSTVDLGSGQSSTGLVSGREVLEEIVSQDSDLSLGNY